MCVALDVVCHRSVRRKCLVYRLDLNCWPICLFNAIQVHDKGAIGLCQHPHRNVVSTYASEGPLKMWKA